MAVPYTRTSSSLTVVVDFRPTVIPSSHPNFKKLIELVAKPGTTDAEVKPLLDIPTAITNFTGDEIKVVGGRLYYRGVEVKDNLAQVILGFVKSGDPAAALPFQKFLANCRQNPDLNLVSTIYDWCVKGNMPITPDGELIAWKIVGSDYLSLHSGRRGRLDHSIGAVVTEPREECDPNRNQTCSTGIHFASLEYIEKGNYGGGLSGRNGNRIVAVVINPADITAIPTDYNLSKGRCCKLRVVGEVEAPKVKGFYDNSGKVYSGWTPSTPATPRNAAGFAVGQVWATRDGGRVTLASITAKTSPAYPVQDTEARVYTASGRYNDDRSTSSMDLVRLIKDVA